MGGPPETSAATGTPIPPPRSRKRAYLVAFTVIGVSVVSLVFSLIVPIAHSFSANIQSPGNWLLSTQNLTFPINSRIAGSWSTSNGTTVSFEIRISYPLGDIVYMSPGGTASGTFSFTATNSTYAFMAGSYAPSTTSVSGTYSMPLL
jgi:hypothetical protein